MKKLHSGDMAIRGTYLNTKSWELVGIEENGEPLPGPWGSDYVKIPVVTVLLVGPVIGLAFIILLPMLAPLALGAALVSRIQPRSRIASWMAMPMAAPARPGLAFLQPEPTTSGSTEAAVGAEKSGEHAEIDTLIAELERQIDQRRQEGRS